MTKPNEPEFCCCGPGEAQHHQSVYLALVAPVGVKFGVDWLASDFVRAFNCVAVLNRGVFCSECGLGVRP